MPRTTRLLTVFAGGTIGTLVRAAILNVSDLHVSGHFSLSTLPLSLITINTLGVFAATWLLVGPLAAPTRQHARLFVVTGLLGGLTSYSSLVADGASVYRQSLGAYLVVVGVAVASAIVAAISGRALAMRGSAR